MPFSLDTFNSNLINHLNLIKAESILDIGAGAGKYGQLCKTVSSLKTIDAVEPTEKYIQEYNLKDIYKNVHQKTIQDFIIQDCKKRYDVVIFGDVLEHFFRSQAIDYIDYFLYRANWVIALWPTFLPQDDAMDNHYEIHKCNFKLADLATKFDVHSFDKKFLWHHWGNPEFTYCEHNYCVMRGYITKSSNTLR